MSPFVQISLAIFLAASLGAIVTIVKQSPLVGYILAGIAVGIYGLTPEAFVQFETMSQLGVTLLLFLVGLELSFSDLRAIGRSATIVGLTQIFLTFILGFVLSLLLHFDQLTSIYIGIAVSFSSTIIVVKLLSEKHALSSFYGRVAVGILLVQDFVAILILMFLGGIEHNSSFSMLSLSVVLLKGGLLLYLTLFLSRSFFPVFMRKVALSPEMIFVTSIAWALGFATFVSLPQVGFSIEIGGFLAGLALANSQEHYQIISRIRPLRDFFITLFFLILGVRLVTVNLSSVIFPALILTSFVLISRPIIILLVMELLGFRKRTSFLTGFTLAQISVFGLIIVSLGEKLGHVNQFAVSLITLVAVLSMILSTYMTFYAPRVYRFLLPLLSYFERNDAKEQLKMRAKFNNHIILIGYNRVGRALLPILEKLDCPLVVVDFDPRVIDQLVASGINAMYGDTADYELLELVSLDKAKMVVSTVPEVKDNLVILERIQRQEGKPLIIMTAAYPRDALRLYEKKADFVLIPHLVGGDHLAQLVNEIGIDRQRFLKLGQNHFSFLLAEWGKRHVRRRSIFYHSL